MTAPEIALQLAPLLGSRSNEVQASTLNGINLESWEYDAIAIALTQGIEEIFALGPTALSEQRYSAVLRDAVNVSFTATQFSTTISAFAMWASWMEGCTIQGGDGEDNELISATELQRPYMGTSTSVNATAYADAVRLPSWIKNTIDPVSSPRVPHFRAASDRDELRFYNSPYIGDDAHRRSTVRGAYYTSRNKTAGEPCAYMVEPRFDPLSGVLPLFLRVNPMPAQMTPLTFRVKRKPPTVSATDITGESILTVAGTLSPNAAGTDYSVIATGFNGAPVFQGGAITQILFNTGAGSWTLQAFSGGLSTQVNCWNLTTDSLSPVGTYTPNGANTGTVTITATGSVSLDIPTDWHQSILLPFAKKWIMSHPAFNNPSAQANIMAQFATAVRTLESFIPQIAPQMGRYH